MIEQVKHSNGVVTFQSRLLTSVGVPHGFSTRVGGVSEGVFSGLNLGNPGEGAQDPAGNIQENFRRLQEALGVSGHVRGWVHQVHGARVELIDHEPEGEYAETLEAEIQDRFHGQIQADGLATGETGVLLTVRVADCVPILLASEDGKVVAALHAGWRGVVAGVVDRGLRVMHEAGAAPDRIVAAIGPAISAANFEVGEEVAESFKQADLAEAVVRGEQKPHVDLQAALKRQLERAGVRKIDGNSLCTFRDEQLFFSHRRDRGQTGRMAAAIARIP